MVDSSRRAEDKRQKPLWNSSHKSTYLLPVDQSKVFFASTNLSLYHVKRMKYAIDFILPEGSDVFAAAKGIVGQVGAESNGNKSVDIVHDTGETTNYSHPSEIIVKKGRLVKGGERIGSSGSTGDLAGSCLTVGTTKMTARLDEFLCVVQDQESCYLVTNHVGEFGCLRSSLWLDTRLDISLC